MKSSTRRSIGNNTDLAQIRKFVGRTSTYAHSSAQTRKLNLDTTKRLTHLPCAFISAAAVLKCGTWIPGCVALCTEKF